MVHCCEPGWLLENGLSTCGLMLCLGGACDLRLVLTQTQSEHRLGILMENMRREAGSVEDML